MPEPSDPAAAVCVTLVTAPDQAVALQLARTLVSERLAACANLVPAVRSIYRYEGAMHEDPEVLLVLKGRADSSAALASRVRELHPYELPEVLALPAVGGCPAYLQWVAREATP